MNLFVEVKEKIKKQAFTLKPFERNGLVIRIHHTDKKSNKIRFLYSSFSENGELIAFSDNKGNVFLIDLKSSKFWAIPNLNSCSFLKFSSHNQSEVILGEINGNISVINIESGLVCCKLIGHKKAVNSISFSNDKLCLTSSDTEAIVWNLSTRSIVKRLVLEIKTKLKSVVFIPNTKYIMGFFCDDLITIWETDTFTTLRVVLPEIWQNFNIKCFEFSRDCSEMVAVGTNQILAFFSLTLWKISKFVTLPEYINTIKCIKFVSTSKNYKDDKIAILSGKGIIYFLDVKANVILSELKTICEIIKFDFNHPNGYLSCILCSGSIEIYKVSHYISRPVKISVKSEQTQRTKRRSSMTLNKIQEIKSNMSSMLRAEKLRHILKEFGEFPSAYRVLIWEHLLQLPNNKQVYDNLIKNNLRSFKNINGEYPLENTRTSKNLQTLLNNLVTWNGFFEDVSYLPIFTFPFVKMFANKPIAAFEAAATIILNWCQYWFEYHPLPPLNILAMIENIIREFDPEILVFFNEQYVTSKEYAWSLLECAFSEVLTSPAWCIFWDHVFLNEPAFLLCSVAAYNLVQKPLIYDLNSKTAIETFFHKQNAIDMKKFVSKCYYVMENCSEDVHPRKYMKSFVKLSVGYYQDFEGFPKYFVEGNNKISNIKNEVHNLEIAEAEIILNKKKELDQLLNKDLESIEQSRLYEMKKACNKNLKDHHKNARDHLKKLVKLREKFTENESKILNYTKSKVLHQNLAKTDLLNDKIELKKSETDYEAKKAEILLSQHYSELLRHKTQIETLINENSLNDEKNINCNLQEEHNKILKEIGKIAENPEFKKNIRHYNITTSLAALDQLIKKVESALSKQLAYEYDNLTKSECNLKAVQLQQETMELEKEVGNLLKCFSINKQHKLQNELTYAKTNVPHSSSTKVNRAKKKKKCKKTSVKYKNPAFSKNVKFSSSSSDLDKFS